ncbi:AEC family transporter [Alteribacillus sp. JSM 102045]|uniref:AEC family transporter n=1 Tax=Alteribacillus sp. JSM 102045 TaxID=1562101 RepID=UPI0035BEE9A1
METSMVFSSISIMAIMIGLGSLVAVKMEITQDMKKLLMFIIFNLAVPAVILNGVFNTELSPHILHQAGVIFGLSIVFHLTALLLTWCLSAVFRFSKETGKKLTILGALGNTGFIGIPLCYILFGPTGGFFAAIFDVGLDVVLFTVVIWMLQAEKSFRFTQLKVLINLPFLALVVGFSALLLNYEAPGAVTQLTELLSGLAAPLAMLYIGLLIPPLFQKQGAILYSQIWFPLIVRLMIIPLLTLFVLSFLPIDNMIKNVVIILSAMPTLMLVAILFAKYTNDEDSATVTTVLSTLLSLSTIPFVSYVASWWL